MSIAPDLNQPTDTATTSTFGRIWNGAVARWPKGSASKPVASWDEQKVTRWFVFVAAVLLWVRKPWGLLNAQLWAEDGPIHLADVDAWGLNAASVPYRGYLQLLPRLIAWASQHLADVAYWPFLYNAAAFLVTIGVLLRFTSTRLSLPGKPWLVLSFVLLAHTGEVWFNLTNLRWLTSFFLLQQLLMDRPMTRAQRVGDLVIVGLAGLTGPFVLIYLPFFIWHWWRDGDREDLAVLLVAAGCAIVQMFCFLDSDLVLEAQSRSLKLGLLLAVIGSRLVVWPLLGSGVAESLSLAALAVIGLTFIAVLLGWSLRAHPRRRLRVYVVTTFGLMTSICMWRIRPDTWASADLVNADSYFYIPRILLGWLVIWEFAARPRAVAYAARAVALLAVYQWARYCDAIRRGDPANIPTLPEGFVFEYMGRPRGAKPPATAVVPVPGVPTTAGRLTNISVLTALTAEQPAFTMGVVVGGTATSGEKPLIMRAVGPSLAALGVSNPLVDPQLTVKLGAQEIAANDQWGASDGPRLRAAFADVGAFGFGSEASRDAALAITPNITGTTSYSVEVGGHGSPGAVLAEIYDTTAAPNFTRTTPRLINFSVLKHMRPDDILTVGFFVGGTKPLRLLIRAIGPTLGGAFGVPNPVDDPKILLLDANRAHVALNNDWGHGGALVATFRKVAAFPLARDSRDAALVITLKPGSYSTQVSLNGGRGGMMLVEVYEVP